MIWGYLSEFWDSVVNTTVGGVEYTAEWFNNIGNAVAGAIGGFFDDLIHHIYDSFYIIYWFADIFTDIFKKLVIPFSWFANLVRGLITGVEMPIEELTLYEPIRTGFDMGGSTIDFFNALPHFSLFTGGLGAILGFYFVIVVIKSLSQA